MTRTALEAAVVSPGGDTRTATRDDADAVAAAWLFAIPCAALVALAIYVLGPPLGHLLSPSGGGYTFFELERASIRPEPTEHGRYLIALSAPLLMTLAVATSPRWLAAVPVRAAELLSRGAQLGLIGVTVAAIVAQRRLLFGAQYSGGEEHPFHYFYFTWTTFTVAALLAATTAALASNERLRGRVAGLLRETRTRRWIALTIGIFATLVWVMPALQSDSSIANAPEALLYHLDFPMDETWAVLNGRTPLVNFTAQYSSLWPFAIALAMTALGKTLLSFTFVVTAIEALSLLAVLGVLRRVTQNSLTALMLYLPFLASSLYLLGGPLDNRTTVGTYIGTIPLRYGGPWFVAWLTARQLARDERPRNASVWLLFTVAGITVLNNGDFGVAALGASVAALLWTGGRPNGRALLRLACLVGAGLATALALVAALTLVRTGSLPQLERLVDYARLYAMTGYALEPIPGVLGTHLLIYITYVGAIGAATVRTTRGAQNRVLTGMLAWAGIFGLGAAAYYVGRSHPVALTHQFSAWSFALALLTIVAIGTLRDRDRRRHTAIGALVVLFGFGVLTCSLAQVPRPWSEVERLNAPFTTPSEWRVPDPLVPPAAASARAFVASIADGPGRFVFKPHAPVALMLTGGHRVADAYGVTDVSPYTGIESMQTVQRVERALDALRDAGGNTVILPALVEGGIFEVLKRRGFEVLTARGLQPYVPGHTIVASHPWPIVGSVIKLVDTHHLHPRALG